MSRRQELDERSRVRLESFQKQEAEIREEEMKELLECDLESEAGRGVRLTAGALAVATGFSPVDALSRIEDLKVELAQLESTLPQIKMQPMSVSPTFPLPSHVTPRLADVLKNVKIIAPKPFSGSYNAAVRDGWILTVKGYFASIGLDLNAHIDEVHAAHAYYIVRSLLSPEVTSGVSPQQWFDTRQLQTPWITTNDVLVAIRAYWVDDHSNERNLLTFRASKQSHLRAREFGSLVQQNAVACTHRQFTDEDLKEVFLSGLEPRFKEHVDMQIRQSTRLNVVNTFASLVDIAADLDATVGRSVPRKPMGVTPSTSSLTVRTDTSLDKISKPSTWLTEATNWQLRFPMSSLSTWQRPPSSKPVPTHLQCFNCGVLGRHYSNNCTSPRIAPGSAPVYVAGVHITQLSTSSSLPSPPVESGKAHDE